MTLETKLCFDISKDDKYPYQPYGFGYDIEGKLYLPLTARENTLLNHEIVWNSLSDGYGNKQWRHEKSQQDSNVIGSYGFKDRDGIMREVEYMADQHGFRARIKTNEPGTAPKDPGDVKFEAQPIVMSSHIRHTPHEESHRDDYEPNSSVQHRIQHRLGKMRFAESVPRYTLIPRY